MKWRYAVAAALGIVLVAVITIGWLVASKSDEVIGMTFVGPIDASGLSSDELTDALESLEADLIDRERIVAIEGTSVAVTGESIGISVDTPTTVEEAMAIGRSNLWETVSTSLFRPSTRLDPNIEPDDVLLADVVETWNTSVIETQPFDGSLEYREGAVVLDPPHSGLAIDHQGLNDLLITGFLGPPEDLISIGTIERAPLVSLESAETAASAARTLVSEDITLKSVNPKVAITFTPDQLGAALISTVEGDKVVPDLDPTVIAKLLEPTQAKLEAPPRDANIVIRDDDRVLIEPSRRGGLIDPSLVVNSLVTAANTASRTGPLIYVEGANPRFSTEDAEALGIVEKVSEFTTEHSCCQPRVTNIHKIADIVDGAIVMPGEEFNVNEFVGPRTREKGFVAAPMILAGRFVDSVGGGISQFATTLYNAVFFGGYTDITHSPHSYYFSRYPEGREATVSFPKPDLIFRNDTDAALLIKTEYTDTSITVKFFGDNGGIDVEAALSERSRYRSPVTEYQPDSSLTPGAERVVSSGSSGWDVTVTRLITHPDGEVIEETWDERYRPQPRIVRRHPCSIPGAVEACPTTTTTTTTAVAPPVPDIPPPTIPEG